MKTKTTLPVKELGPEKWVLIDAEDKVLGRLATKIATILMGKDNPTYTPHLDVGNGVIVVNVSKIKVTGKKNTDKLYYFHTRHPGGLKAIPYNKIVEKKPEYPLMHAVRLMLPKNKMGRKLLKRLRIYPGAEHTQQAQKPIIVE